MHLSSSAYFPYCDISTYIHFVANGRISFFFFLSYICNIFFACSSFDGHLSSIHTSSIVNNPAINMTMGLPRWLRVKNLPANPVDPVGSILGSGRSLGEERATHPSILTWKNPIDRGSWWATIHGVTKSCTRLGN